MGIGPFENDVQRQRRLNERVIFGPKIGGTNLLDPLAGQSELIADFSMRQPSPAESHSFTV
jgi:hypothetical protein